MFNFVRLLKYKRQMTGNKLCLPVIWRSYFNKLTKLNIQFLNNRWTPSHTHQASTQDLTSDKSRACLDIAIGWKGGGGGGSDKHHP